MGKCLSLRMEYKCPWLTLGRPACATSISAPKELTESWQPSPSPESPTVLSLGPSEPCHPPRQAQEG